MISLQRDTRDEHDEVTNNAHAWAALARNLPGVEELTITTGSNMLDTFNGDFMSRAFPFLYKSQLAQPDVAGRGQSREQKGGRNLSTLAHAACMSHT